MIEVQLSTTSQGWLVFEPRAGRQIGVNLLPRREGDPRAYAPQAHDIAAAGHKVVIVPMLLNLAILSPDRAGKVMAAYPNIDKWAIRGPFAWRRDGREVRVRSPRHDNTGWPCGPRTHQMATAWQVATCPWYLSPAPGRAGDPGKDRGHAPPAAPFNDIRAHRGWRPRTVRLVRGSKRGPTRHNQRRGAAAENSCRYQSAAEVAQ